MYYAIMIYADENVYTQMTREEKEAHMRANDASVERHGDKIRIAAALHDVAAATTVRVRDGKTLISNGPFAETREQLGGWCIVECDDLDEALEIAARSPDAVHGSIEVRPVWGFHVGEQAATGAATAAS